MPPMGLGYLNWLRRNRQAAPPSPELPQLEPDYTQPEELRARGLAEQPPRRQTFTERHPFIAAVRRARGVQDLEQEQAETEQKFTLEEARRARQAQDEQAIKLMDPALASNETLADAIARAREADELVKHKLEEAQVPGYTNVAGKQIPQKPATATKPEKSKGVMTVGPEQGIYDRDTKEFIREPKFRPKPRTSRGGGGGGSSSENLREKHIEGANKAKATSRRLNDLMHAITNEARGEPGGWDRPYIDPDGKETGLTRRQAYESFKKQNQDAVAEINRQWDEAGGVVGRPILDAGPGVRNEEPLGDDMPHPAAMPAPPAGDIGYSKEQIEQLRQAMDEDDRDEFDSYSPEDKKKVLDEAYGRNIRR